jgi:uncharacterized protein YdaU (DUF1376 family)
MTPEQRGAYIDLLAYAWGNGDDPPALPDDDAKLAALSGLGKRWFKVGQLVRDQFSAANGLLLNERLSEVWVAQQARYQKLAKAGKAGGDAKAKGKQTASDATASVKHIEVEVERETTTATASGASQEPTPEFLTAWRSYPRRLGSNPRLGAWHAWQARVREGESVIEMGFGVDRYRKFCQSQGKVGTEFVMQGSRFFGPKREYEQEWVVPQEQPLVVDGVLTEYGERKTRPDSRPVQ